MDLDARQRAMLLEMGVRVWSPAGAAGLPGATDAVEAGNAAELPAGRRDAPARTTATPTLPQTKTLAGTEAGISGALRPAARPESPSPIAAQFPQLAPARSAAPAHSAATESPATSTPPGPLLPASERAAAIAQMNWPALQQAVSGCRACALCESRRHTVFGVGQTRPHVDWLIIGEAPGEREDNLGEPFVGPAGQLLDAMLQAIGLKRANDAGQDAQRADQPTVFITNVLKCRPPGNRNPQPTELAQCVPHLERQIALLQPRLILALGRFAAQTLLAPTMPEAMTLPLGKLRGQPHAYGATGIPVVVSYHPAYLLRNLPDKAKSWADLVLAMQVLQSAPPR